MSSLSSSVAKKGAEKERWEQRSAQAPADLVSPLLPSCPPQLAGGHGDTRGRMVPLSLAISRLLPGFAPFTGAMGKGHEPVAAGGTQSFSSSAAKLVHGVVQPLKSPQTPTRLPPGRISFFCLTE